MSDGSKKAPRRQARRPLSPPTKLWQASGASPRHPFPATGAGFRPESSLGLFGELRVAVAFDQVLWQLEVPECVQSPFRVPYGGLGAVDDLVLSAPEEELADPLRELPRRAHDEVDRGRYGGVQVRVAH